MIQSEYFEVYNPRGKNGCACGNARQRLASSIGGDYGALLGCTCEHDEVSGRCQCTEQPWGKLLLSEYCGQDFLNSPQELDDVFKPALYRMGRYLHCQVRRFANNLIRSSNLDLSISECETEVFSRKFHKIIDLREMKMHDLLFFFYARTRFVHQTHLSRELRVVINDRQLSPELVKEWQVRPPLVATPCLITAGGNPFLTLIRNMPNRAWRDAWTTIFILETSGLSISRNDSHAQILRSGWPSVSGLEYSMESLRERILSAEAKLQALDKEIAAMEPGSAEARKKQRTIDKAIIELKHLFCLESLPRSIRRKKDRIEVEKRSDGRRRSWLDSSLMSMENDLAESMRYFQAKNLRIWRNRGNRYVKDNLKDVLTLQDANELALAFDREGIVSNLRHVFATDQQIQRFQAAYLSEANLRRASHRDSSQLEIHAEQLFKEIYDGEDEDEELVTEEVEPSSYAYHRDLEAQVVREMRALGL